MSAPKMRRLGDMVIYTGRHLGAGYVVTGSGSWWTHDGESGTEENDEEAFKKVLKVIEEKHGTQQGENLKGPAQGERGGSDVAGEGKGDCGS